MTQPNTYESATIEYDYRPDPSPRPAMLTQGTATLAADLDRMRQQDYAIRRVTIDTMCATCSGSGRVRKTRKVRGKGGKTVVKIVPYAWVQCDDCNGHYGPLATRDYPLA